MTAAELGLLGIFFTEFISKAIKHLFVALTWVLTEAFDESSIDCVLASSHKSYTKLDWKDYRDITPPPRSSAL